MPIVIVGAGIIGVSTAYYLSELKPSKADGIHLIESSPDLFASASGLAGGFLAADWFSPPLAKLGLLSFQLHKGLAEANKGHERWGYSQSTGTSLAETIDSNGGSGADWLREGASRAIAAANTEPESGHAPKWLNSKGALDILSSGETTAQIDPRSLCDFLLSTCLSRGVHLHQPCRPISLSRTSSGTLSHLTILNTSTTTQQTLPCTRLVLAAGAWCPTIFRTLFPTSKLHLPISSLSGHSLLLRSPHWPPPALDPSDPASNPANTDCSQSKCHAIFTTDAESDYSPELFSRMPNGEIYLAGLNSTAYPLPAVANERKVDKGAIEKLKRTARRLLGEDVVVERESVCWRPVTRRGVPAVCEMKDEVGKEGEGVFLAAGHGAWGISLSLGTGWCVARMVEGEDVSELVGRLGL